MINIIFDFKDAPFFNRIEIEEIKSYFKKDHLDLSWKIIEYYEKNNMQLDCSKDNDVDSAMFFFEITKVDIDNNSVTLKYAGVAK
jgi:hypothetical protein